jgi:hypothetical protein
MTGSRIADAQQRWSSQRLIGFLLQPVHPILRVAVGISVGVAQASDAVAQQVPDAVSCPRCAVQVEELVSFGSPAAPIPGDVRDILHHGGRYWLLFGGEPLLAYDERGRLIGQFGRRGQGPGEFLDPVALLPASGDSVAVLDRGNLRATVLGPDLRMGRTVTAGMAATAARVVRWPDRILLNGQVEGASSGYPLHLASAAAKELDFAVSFGHERGSARPGEWGKTFQIPAHGTDLWVADLLRYRLTLWSETGTARQVLERAPSWFQPSDFPHRGGPTKPPAAMIAAVAQDAEGQLWVYSLTPAANWADAWKGQPRTGGGERSVHSGPSATDLYRCIVEVIDPRSARVVARGALPGLVISTTGSGTVATYTIDTHGEPRITVYRVGLRSRQGS